MAGRCGRLAPGMLLDFSRREALGEGRVLVCFRVFLGGWFGGRIGGEILDLCWGFLLCGGVGGEVGVTNFESGRMVLNPRRILKICVTVCFSCLCWEAQGLYGLRIG